MNLPSASSRLLLIGIAANHLFGKCDALLLRGQETKRGADDRDHDMVTSHEHPVHRKLPKGGWQTSASCKIVGTEKVGIYIGGGSTSRGGICDTCVKWAEALAAFWSTGMRGPAGSGLESAKLNSGAGGSSPTFAGDGSITYLTLTTSEFEACYNGELNSLSLLVMPGGSAYEIQDALGSGGKAAITNYLDQGGNYLGFCAGGYYMTRGYYWKGYDGSPSDNCDEQFCRYEVSGTYSYDTTTKDFSVHEWGGTSYHSNLVAYGPLANVFVEGPIEEIAGPWSLSSNPNAPYDSHVVLPTDPNVPVLLRQIYYGGATENYIHTNTSLAAADWGTAVAHFRSNATDQDHDFPSNLWTLKEANTGHQGGKVIISSAHIEASVFHTSIGDAGMTECQNYNNYVFLTRSISTILGMNSLPEYDTNCLADIGGGIKDTKKLFPNKLAYATAPRVESGGGGGGGGGGSGGGGGCGANLASLQLIDFEDNNLVGTLSGTAARPWAVNNIAACDGTIKGITAGVDSSGAKGVDTETLLSITVPDGATSMSYFYSYPSALDIGDDFHVSLYDPVLMTTTVLKEYETGSGASCASECVAVSPGKEVVFKCKSGGNNEICSVDEIQFHG